MDSAVADEVPSNRRLPAEPICYSSVAEGSTFTTFQRTECNNGYYTHKFESAEEFSISELLTNRVHGYLHDGDQTTSSMISAVTDNVSSSTGLQGSINTAKTNGEQPTKLTPTVNSTTTSSTGNAEVTPEDSPESTRFNEEVSTKLTQTVYSTSSASITPVMTLTTKDSSDTSSVNAEVSTKLTSTVHATPSTPTPVVTLTTEDEDDVYVFHIISENNTDVTSPNFPSHYDNKLSFWVSIRPPDKLSRVSLTFTSFDIEDSSDCTADSVLILGTIDPQPICGSTLPPPVTSLGNIMEIYFKSDSKTARPGFEAVIQFLDPDPEYRTPAPGICESVYVQSNTSTVLTSPGSRVIYRNIQCGYIIHADVGKTITVSFNWINLEDCPSRADNQDFEPDLSSYDIPAVILGVEHVIDVASCLCDSLQIFDGFDAKAPNLTDRLCYYYTPDDSTSTGNIMYMYLETDNDVRTGGFSVDLSVT